MNQGRQTATLRSRLLLGLIGLAAISVLAVGIVLVMTRQRTAQNQSVEFPHIHGLGFSSDGTQLFVPAHIGLIVFANNAWSIPELPRHDYMGYSAVDAGFYSSGHPDLRTDYDPLLGLIKSEDTGHTITMLAFEGESDFHLLAAGYHNHAVYVVNVSPNSQIGQGLFYTLDEGQTWQQSQANGLEGSPIQVAVHPDESGRVAVATESGLWLSNDYGNTFSPMFASEPVTAIAFDLDENALYFAYRQLYRLDLGTGEIIPLPTPQLANNDTLMYLANSPTSGQMATATGEKDIFISIDGTTWTQIASNGIGET